MSKRADDEGDVPMVRLAKKYGSVVVGGVRMWLLTVSGRPCSASLACKNVAIARSTISGIDDTYI